MMIVVEILAAALVAIAAAALTWFGVDLAAPAERPGIELIRSTPVSEDVQTSIARRDTTPVDC